MVTSSHVSTCAGCQQCYPRENTPPGHHRLKSGFGCRHAFLSIAFRMRPPPALGLGPLCLMAFYSKELRHGKRHL